MKKNQKWRCASSSEWSLSSPPPYHQFETLPVIEDHHTYHNHLGSAEELKGAH